MNKRLIILLVFVLLTSVGVNCYLGYNYFLDDESEEDENLISNCVNETKIDLIDSLVGSYGWTGDILSDAIKNPDIIPNINYEVVTLEQFRYDFLTLNADGTADAHYGYINGSGEGAHGIWYASKDGVLLYDDSCVPYRIIDDVVDYALCDPYNFYTYKLVDGKAVFEHDRASGQLVENDDLDKLFRLHFGEK